MGANYIFSIQPTFTQGLVLGQLSVLVLLVLILKYLFLDSTQNPFETSSYQPRLDRNIPQKSSSQTNDDVNQLDKSTETAEWFNSLVHQVVDIYRSKLRDDLPGIAGDEIARKRVEDYANKIRPPGFIDYIKIHSVDLGIKAPRLSNAHLGQQDKLLSEIEFDVEYTDTLSLSLSTSYLFNYPISSFARLPVSLTISLSKFQSSILVTPPRTASVPPTFTISIPPAFTLDLSTTSLMGSRAKLANVPKLHELIQHHVRRILASRGTWKVVLPGLSNIKILQDELRKEIKEKSS
ncbi:maintenance of mitochondrial morphology protein 1 [Collybia nuda]|uniref:Maintenance of mitochondrial morphology protein 1 n=1 Tax=Collybia nuda TaxID=64659 RepID=A0A9P5XYW7_9AGAR|nr:maintenance of mitochondrial morphology protein 1 [Collybia nuda]